MGIYFFDDDPSRGMALVEDDALGLVAADLGEMAPLLRDPQSALPAGIHALMSAQKSSDTAKALALCVSALALGGRRLQTAMTTACFVEAGLKASPLQMAQLCLGLCLFHRAPTAQEFSAAQAAAIEAAMPGYFSSAPAALLARAPMAFCALLGSGSLDAQKILSTLDTALPDRSSASKAFIAQLSEVRPEWKDDAWRAHWRRSSHPAAPRLNAWMLTPHASDSRIMAGACPQLLAANPLFGSLLLALAAKDALGLGASGCGSFLLQAAEWLVGRSAHWDGPALLGGGNPGFWMPQPGFAPAWIAGRNPSGRWLAAMLAGQAWPLFPDAAASGFPSQGSPCPLSSAMRLARELATLGAAAPQLALFSPTGPTAPHSSSDLGQAMGGIVFAALAAARGISLAGSEDWLRSWQGADGQILSQGLLSAGSLAQASQENRARVESLLLEMEAPPAPQDPAPVKRRL